MSIPPSGDPAGPWSSPWAQPPGGSQPGDNPADQPVSGYPQAGYGYPDPVSGYPQQAYPAQNAWGAPALPPGYPMYAPPRKQNGLAIASMVTSIAAFLVCAGLPGIVGALMGHSARKQIRQTGEDGEGFATAGIIVGWIGFGLSLVFILFYVGIFLVVGFGALTSSSSSGY
jgi:hypothetical protein